MRFAAVVTTAAMSKMSTQGERRQRKGKGGSARERDGEAGTNTEDGSATRGLLEVGRETTETEPETFASDGLAMLKGKE